MDNDNQPFRTLKKSPGGLVFVVFYSIMFVSGKDMV